MSLNNNTVKVDMVTADEMSESDRNAIFNQEASINAIPDLDILTGHMYEILEYLEKPLVKNLMKTNKTAVTMHLNNKYADTVPYGIITLLMEEENKDENVEGLLRMFENLRRAKRGEISLEEGEKALTDEVNERYLYSEYGSKEEFEKALEKEVKKEQKKNKNSSNLSNIGKMKIKK